MVYKRIHMPSKIRPSALKMKQCIQLWGLTHKSGYHQSHAEYCIYYLFI